ncbi:MAG: ATP-binding protein [Paludibacteraceae bacterium]|nr:ATP-binding protein [Paludibacteraceae bacterium]
MRHLIIKNLGPLKEANVELGHFNLIIGSQSSGKSCVLRIASFCAWVEKRIELSQSSSYFANGKTFKEEMISYHKLDGYFKFNTYISYESDFMKFSYDNDKFIFSWKRKSLEYKRPKISYIPSERNVVSLIPDWKLKVSTYDCILDFMKDWDIARKYLMRTPNILNLGLGYEYNSMTNEDKMILKDGGELFLSNSSSGVQSLVPMYVCLNYLTNGVYVMEFEPSKKKTEIEREEYKNLYAVIYKNCISNTNTNTINSIDNKQNIIIGSDSYTFYNNESLEMFLQCVKNYSFTQHSDIYLEEPEDNLFPPTQCQLMNLFLEYSKRRKRQVSMSIATHSPYILTHLLEQRPRGFKLFFTYDTDEGYIVKTATLDDMQEIIDNGVDMFFNFESFIY